MDGDIYYGSTGKRSYPYLDDDAVDRNSRRKKRTSSVIEPNTQSGPVSHDTEYRILCPVTKIGSVIGKGGSIIKALRQECRSKIKVEDPVPGSDERVIYIFSSRESRDSENGFLCCAQEALFRVHARIVDGEGGASDEDDDEPPHTVTARLLVPNNQIGCLLGKGGRIIEQMRREIGGQIRVMPKEQLPPCASSTDELVQLSGDAVLVKKALKAVSSRLYENPPRERAQGGSRMSQGPSGISTMPTTGGGLYSSGSYLSQGGSLLAPSIGGMGGLGHPLPPLGGGYGGTGIGNVWPLGPGVPAAQAIGSTVPNAVRGEGSPEDEMLIRVLCPNERIGSMIGKGGNVIRKMREETGAKIKVGDPVPDSEERVMEIYSTEFMESMSSPGIEAALQVHRRLVDLQSEKDKDIQSFTARLLVPSNQIGCLLGKGGSIISEMRKLTKANIRIPPKEELPKCAGENDELVQIMGDQNVVQDALIQVLTRLRNNLFKGRDGGAGGAMLPLSGMDFSGSTMLSSCGGRHEPAGSPGRMYSWTNVGLPGMDYGSYGAASGGSDLQASSEKGSKDYRRRQR